jgi:hypothetical protein
MTHPSFVWAHGARSILCTLACVLAFALPMIGRAQTSGGRPGPIPVGPPPAPVDPEWASLSNVRIRRAPQGAGTVELERAKQAEAKAWAEQADRLLAFRDGKPDHKKAGEARQLELMTLVYAARAGAAMQEERQAKLLAEVRTDKSLPAALRFEAVAACAYGALQRGERLEEKAWLGSCEQIERALVAEFPELPNGYEGLLGVARDSGDEAGRAIVRELLKMDAVPEAVRERAQVLLDRYALIGGALDKVLPAESLKERKKDDGAGKPGPIVVYAWATWSRGSIAFGRMLSETAPAGTRLIGINLDADSAAAREAASKEKLPGEILYDADAKGALARDLAMNSAPLAYTADADGRVLSVSAVHDLARAARKAAAEAAALAAKTAEASANTTPPAPMPVPANP